MAKLGKETRNRRVVLIQLPFFVCTGVDVPFEILLGSTCSDVDKFISTAQKRKLQVSFDLSNQWADEIVLPGLNFQCCVHFCVFMVSTDWIEFDSSSVNSFKCCVLTGASGFLGSFILKELLVRGCRVRALVRSEKKLRNDVERYKVCFVGFVFRRFVVSQRAKKRLPLTGVLLKCLRAIWGCAILVFRTRDFRRWERRLIV